MQVHTLDTPLPPIFPINLYISILIPFRTSSPPPLFWTSPYLSLLSPFLSPFPFPLPLPSLTFHPAEYRRQPIGGFEIEKLEFDNGFQAAPYKQNAETQTTYQRSVNMGTQYEIPKVRKYIYI